MRVISLILSTMLLCCCDRKSPATVEAAMAELMEYPTTDTLQIGDTLISRGFAYTDKEPFFNLRVPGQYHDFLVELESAIREKGEYAPPVMNENAIERTGSALFNRNCMVCHHVSEWQTKSSVFFKDRTLKLGDLPAFEKDKPHYFHARGKTFVHYSGEQKHEYYFVLQPRQREYLEAFLRLANDTTLYQTQE